MPDPTGLDKIRAATVAHDPRKRLSPLCMQGA